MEMLLVGGIAAGTARAVVETPFELAKVRYQTGGGVQLAERLLEPAAPPRARETRAPRHVLPPRGERALFRDAAALRRPASRFPLEGHELPTHLRETQRLHHHRFRHFCAADRESPR